MSLLRAGSAAIALLVIGDTVVAQTSSTARDRISHNALVGIVIPTFTGDLDDGTASFLSQVYKEAIRSQNRSMDGDRFVGYSTVYFPNAPLRQQTHEVAVQTAQQSYFQATVWGEVDRYSYLDTFEGYSITTFFSYAPNQYDLRAFLQSDLRLEIWLVEHENTRLELPIPSEFRELPPYLISEEAVVSLSSGSTCFEHVDGNSCISIDEFGPARLKSIDLETGRAFYTRFGYSGLYSILLPHELLVPQPAISYPAMYLSYARGNWSRSIEMANQIIDSESSSTELIVDALLYAGASAYRSGSSGRVYIERAINLAPYSQVASRYLIAAGLNELSSGVLSEDDFMNLVWQERLIAGSDWIETVLGEVPVANTSP